MERFTRLTGRAVSLPEADIDTDIIFPARFLTHTEKVGLGRFAFFDRRYTPDGESRPEAAFSPSADAGTPILIAGENFGCGSSREQAVWALRDLGLRCVIAPSFGEIFHANAFRNGLLPVILPAWQVAALTEEARAGRPLTVNLEAGAVTRADGESFAFETAPWRREALLNGWDEIELILNAHAADIAAFERQDAARRPWLHPSERPAHG